MFSKPKLIISIVVLVVGLILLSTINPMSWNRAGYRTVIEQADGKQFVRYKPGIFYAGFFAKEDVWPNQISVSHKDSIPNLTVEDNNIDIGRITIRFNDATTANMSGIVQYILPVDEKQMIALHNAHRNLASLVVRRLSPYTKECLQSSAQLMSSEMHYGGGRAQMAQDYLDQLKNGAFLLATYEVNVYDSLEKDNKRFYQTKMQRDPAGEPKRKFSSIKEYGITVADAQITDVDYETKVDQMLAKKIDASTKASISKQELMTAQQQKLTAEAEGQKKLVEIEYQQKQEQTKQVVAAQTKVKLAEQDKLQQQIAYEGSILEAKKIRELASARAFEKEKMIRADGALQVKIDAWKEVQGYWAEAFKGYTGNVVPTYMMGGGNNGGGNAAANFMEIMGMKAARDLNFNPNPTGNEK